MLQHSIEHDKKGFSLLEVTITMAIVLTIFSMILPSYKEIKQKTSFNSAKADLLLISTQLTQLDLVTESNQEHILLITKILNQHAHKDYHYEFFNEEKTNNYWLRAMPKINSLQHGHGGITLTNFGYGCWHKNTDRPSTPECDENKQSYLW